MPWELGGGRVIVIMKNHSVGLRPAPPLAASFRYFLYFLHFLNSQGSRLYFLPRHHCQLGPTFAVQRFEHVLTCTRFPQHSTTQSQNTETSYLIYYCLVQCQLASDAHTHTHTHTRAHTHTRTHTHLLRPKRKASLFKKSIWWSLLLDHCEIKMPYILAGPQHG